MSFFASMIQSVGITASFVTVKPNVRMELMKLTVQVVSDIMNGHTLQKSTGLGRHEIYGSLVVLVGMITAYYATFQYNYFALRL